MTHEEKEAIRERCNKATPGPWLKYAGRILDVLDGEDEYHGINIEEQDLNFIAHARQDIPALLAALDKAESRIEALERAIKLQGMCDTCGCDSKSTYFANHLNCPGCSDNGSRWQFDEARFSKHGGSNERV